MNLKSLLPLGLCLLASLPALASGKYSEIKMVNQGKFDQTIQFMAKDWNEGNFTVTKTDARNVESKGMMNKPGSTDSITLEAGATLKISCLEEDMSRLFSVTNAKRVPMVGKIGYDGSEFSFHSKDPNTADAFAKNLVMTTAGIVALNDNY